MNTHELNIRLALNIVPDWDLDSAVLKEIFANSITSVTYLIERQKKSYVLRIDKPFINGISPNRKNESIIRRAISKHNISPKLIYTNPDKGILLNAYLEGNIWQERDIHSEPKLIRLAHRLKKLHGLKIDAEKFDLMGGIKSYISELGTQQAKDWGAQAITLLSECSQRPTALCHNDLHASNILEADDLYFLDWEYAGLGNPLFDVATIFQHHQLTKQQRDVFLDNYLGAVSDIDKKDIHIHTKIYDLLLALWLSILIKSTDLDATQTSQSLEQLQTVTDRINTELVE